MGFRSQAGHPVQSGVGDLPVWTQDGKSRNLWWAATMSFQNLPMAAVPEESLTDGGGFPTSVSPDGRFLAFWRVARTTGTDIWILPLGDRTPRPWLQTPANEGAPVFSPDGRWLAYVSNESGRYEVYVQPFPGPGQKVQISSEGGAEPVWSPNGKELFYRNGDKVMIVPVSIGPSLPRADLNSLPSTLPTCGRSVRVQCRELRYLSRWKTLPDAQTRRATATRHAN